tara:strand:+ start:252 stop:458 length:207 start_codon:yes stop_codon:yes gene_type:complete
MDKPFSIFCIKPNDLSKKKKEKINETIEPKNPNPVERKRTVINVINKIYTINNLFNLGVISTFDVREE